MAGERPPDLPVMRCWCEGDGCFCPDDPYDDDEENDG